LGHNRESIAEDHSAAVAPSGAAPPAIAGQDKVRFGNIDLLRFCAAMLVVLYHLTYTGHAAHGLNPIAFPELLSITQHRWVGAWLFFMLSGFGISYAARRDTASRFLVGRLARIYPTFLACMCLTSLVLVFFAPAGFVEFQMTLSRWAANLTMAPMLLKQPFVDGVYWSIAVEVIFYLGVDLAQYQPAE
jgi:peptidoglycan/LPS O-acetylase OafA/YrhL